MNVDINSRIVPRPVPTEIHRSSRDQLADETVAGVLPRRNTYWSQTSPLHTPLPFSAPCGRTSRMWNALPSAGATNSLDPWGENDMNPIGWYVVFFNPDPGTSWRDGGSRKCATRLSSPSRPLATSTIFTHTLCGFGARPPATRSSADRLSDVLLTEPALTEPASSTDSVGALLARRLFRTSFAALAPILMPAQTPRATPPPISTADVRIAPCVVWGGGFGGAAAFSFGRENAVVIEPRPSGPGKAAASSVVYAKRRPDRLVMGRRVAG